MLFALPLEKGGVGKTTSSQNLAVEMAWDGIPRSWPSARKKLKQATTEEEVATILTTIKQQEYTLVQEQPPHPILGVDIDAQRNFSMGSGVFQSDDETSICEVLLNSEYGIDYVLKQSSSGIYMIPGSKNLTNLEDELKIDRERRLSQALRDAEGYAGHKVDIQAVGRFKQCIIDCPPNMGLFTNNALAAADYLLVPMQVHFYAYEAMTKLEEAIRIIRRINKKLEIGGIFCTQYDPSTNLSKDIRAQLRERYGSLVFETLIPRNTELAEAPLFGLSIQQYNHQSAGAKAYKALYQEIKVRFGL